MRAGGAWALLGVLCAAAAVGAERVDVLVRHANVVDVVAGRVLPDQDIAARVFEWRAEVAAGELLGPTIYGSGPKIEGPGTVWHGTQEVGTREQMLGHWPACSSCRPTASSSTDDKLAPDPFLQAVAEAHARGLRTSAQVQLAITTDEASAAGLC